jgi:hypothetical protein
LQTSPFSTVVGSAFAAFEIAAGALQQAGLRREFPMVAQVHTDTRAVANHWDAKRAQTMSRPDP